MKKLLLKLTLKLTTLILIIGNLLNIYIFIFQIPKTKNYALDEYVVNEFSFDRLYSTTIATPFEKKGLFGWCKDFDFVKLAKIEGKTYFMAEKYFEDTISEYNACVFGGRNCCIWYDDVHNMRIVYDSNGDIISLFLRHTNGLLGLDKSHREETEILAKEYFEKYLSKNLKAKEGKNAEYRMFYKRRAFLNNPEDDPEALKVYEGYNDTEYDQLNQKLELYYDGSVKQNYYKYSFVKYVNGKATNEYIDVAVYVTGELCRINSTASYPLLAEDDIEYNEEKLNETVKTYLYEDHYDSEKSPISDIRISKNLLHKDALGRRGIASFAVIEREDGEKTTDIVYTLLENTEFSVRYPIFAFVIIETLIFSGTVIWIIWRIRTKKAAKK